MRNRTRGWSSSLVNRIEGGGDPLGERGGQLFARQLLESDIPNPPHGLQLSAALGAGLEVRLDFRPARRVEPPVE
jgi:hypothetical protein